MLRRLINLWNWSNLSPYNAGQEAGTTIVEALKEFVAPQRSEIVYPDKVREVLQQNPEAALDELISR